MKNLTKKVKKIIVKMGKEEKGCKMSHYSILANLLIVYKLNDSESGWQ